ncbi:MAG: helix-turn-helix domain-containing protein [Ktedonobacteraceae bacterium]|nr:helix-turn-helix domain-containing protein [Ktedonobacteraceae bacterium]
MERQYYTAKEAMEILKKPNATFYREVKAGLIPHVGKRPNMRFPKEAIDALAEVGTFDQEETTLTFIPSTIASAWEKQEMAHPYEDQDLVPFKNVLEWRKVNSELSMDVREGNKLRGWITFLPLDEKIILALIHDKMREKDIPLRAIKRWSEKQLSVYIPIIEVILSGNKGKDRRIGVYLLKKAIKWAISLTIRYDIKNWYSIGVTTDGQAILETLGFKEIASLEGGKRKAYMLETKIQPVRLVSAILNTMEEQKALPEKAASKVKTTRIVFQDQNPVIKR